MIINDLASRDHWPGAHCAFELKQEEEPPIRPGVRPSAQIPMRGSLPTLRRYSTEGRISIYEWDEAPACSAHVLAIFRIFTEQSLFTVDPT